jgi:4a-hydroxytetrahydrobiopterin dehydratase
MSWVESHGSLIREIRTPDFLSAFRLASAFVAPAEAMGHHPDLTFGWGFVRICLTTHDVGGVTELDRALAKTFDRVVSEFLGECHTDVTKPL